MCFWFGCEGGMKGFISGKGMEPDRLKDEIKAFYEQNERYHELIGESERRGLTYDEILLQWIHQSAVAEGRPVRFLDVALGTGYYVNAARKAGAMACGVDLSTNACRFARERFDGLRVVRSDAECLPFRDGFFDMVLCLQLLEHTPFPERVIAEIARVLRPGGNLFLSAPNLLGGSLFARFARSFRGYFSKDIKCLQPLPSSVIDRWDSAATTQEVSDLDACNRINVFHALNLLRENGFSIKHLDTLSHPRKYRPARYTMEKVFQRIPFLKYTGVNFKIIAEKRRR